jgi:hypothetical protein
MRLWSKQDHDKEKHDFVEARKEHVSWLGLSLVFGVTFFTTWLVSAATLRQGLVSMPLRYALAMLVGYGIFFASVRVWADFQKKHPSERSKSGDWNGDFGGDLPGADAEGCLIAFAALAVAFIFSALVAWFGSVLFLEVAFEVIFAGVLVRRFGRSNYEVGGWKILLFRRTWLFVTALIVSVSAGAHYLQSQYPEARSLYEVLNAGKK